MPYPAAIHRAYDTPRNNVAFVYSTKDRIEFTQQTFPAVTAASGFDIIWCDGSKTAAGQQLPFNYLATTPQLKEIHSGVVGGPDAAITYGLTYALAQGYDYVGLIENDVLLAPGWFDAMFALFAKGAADGLTVGSVSARTYTERVLGLHNDYAIMFNIGAGMLLLSRTAAQVVLQNYMTGTLQDIWQTAHDMSDTDVSGHWEHASVQPDLAQASWQSADWWYDIALMRHGFASLGLVTPKATVIDPAVLGMTFNDLTPANKIKIAPLNFATLQARLREAFDSTPSPINYLNQFHFHPSENGWLIFPHQLAAAVTDAFQGIWRSKWQQHYGPFSAVAGDEARLVVPVNGAPLIALFLTQDDANNLLTVTLGDTVQQIALVNPNAHMIPIMVTGSWDGPSPLVIQPPPGAVFTGLICLSPQPWMMRKLPFDFNTIQAWFD